MSVKQLNPPNPLFFYGIPTKIKWKIHPLFTSQVLKVLLTKNCKISHQIFYFLLFYISFYISRHHFSQIFRTFFNIIWKMIFAMNFPFLINSIKPPTLHPLNGQHWLKVTKVLCWCSLWKVWRLSWIIYKAVCNTIKSNFFWSDNDVLCDEPKVNVASSKVS